MRKLSAKEKEIYELLNNDDTEDLHKELVRKKRCEYEKRRYRDNPDIKTRKTESQRRRREKYRVGDYSNAKPERWKPPNKEELEYLREWYNKKNAVSEDQYAS